MRVSYHICDLCHVQGETDYCHPLWIEDKEACGSCYARLEKALRARKFWEAIGIEADKELNGER